MARHDRLHSVEMSGRETKLTAAVVTARRADDAVPIADLQSAQLERPGFVLARCSTAEPAGGGTVMLINGRVVAWFDFTPGHDRPCETEAVIDF